MKGNKNAEKWTLELAEEFCNKVLDIIENNKKIRTIGKACLEAGKYENILDHFNTKFGFVFDSIKRAKEIAKQKLIEDGLNNDVNTTMAIFILKNNHDMKDRSENTNTTNLNVKSIEPIDWIEDAED